MPAHGSLASSSFTGARTREPMLCPAGRPQIRGSRLFPHRRRPTAWSPRPILGGAFGGRFDILRHGRQLRHGRRRVGCRLEQRVLDGRDEPGGVGCPLLDGEQRGEGGNCVPLVICPRCRPLDQRHENPRGGHHTGDDEGIELRDRRGGRHPDQKQHLEEQARHRRATSNGCPDRAHPGEGWGRPGISRLVAPAGLRGRKTRPSESAHVGLKGLDPIGQLADDLGELGLGLAPVRRLLGRRHAAGPSSFIASIASRAFAWTRARRSSSVSRGFGLAVRLGLSLRRERASELLGGIGRVDRCLIGHRGGRAGALGRGAAFRLESRRPSAAMPTIPASQASERFTRRWYRARRWGRQEGELRLAIRQLPYIPLPASPRPGHSQLVLAGEAA